MSFVLDASIAAAWFLPDEQNDAADELMDELKGTKAFVPSLFWFEIRNLFLMAERRGRLDIGDASLLLKQLRCFPLRDLNTINDEMVFDLARRHELSAYDASYLALALQRQLPLATADRRLVSAARQESIIVLGCEAI